MSVTKTVKVSKSHGPVMVEIKAKKTTRGKFIFYVQTDESNPEIFKGEFGDAIPDIFMMPFGTDKLNEHNLYMIGNFAPADMNSDVISFDVNFYQNGKCIDTLDHTINFQGIKPIDITFNFDVKE